MNNRSMFPYRRGNGKKRSRGNNKRGREGGQRRSSGSPHELLSVMQSATKALAQVLVGNTKPSGQLVHARNILEQADQLVQDRVVDRMPPQAREDFLEQLARLKLTISDAADIEDEAREAESQAAEIEEVEPKKEVGADRLREVALKLAAIGSSRPPTTTASENEKTSDDEPDEEAQSVDELPVQSKGESESDRRSAPRTGVRSSKLRLNVKRDGQSITSADAS